MENGNRPPRAVPASLIAGFLIYLVLYMLLEILGFGALGFEKSGAITLLQVVIQCMAMIVAIVLGFAYALGSGDVELGEIGFKLPRFRDILKWGIGGYFASLPFVVGTAMLWLWLINRFFPDAHTPVHPLIPVVRQGGWILFGAIVMAVVIGPIVEEIAFRGMLLGGLRRIMGFWPAALLSSVIFSIVHPTLPGQFLPIFVLGVVLSVLRQYTSSLTSGMLCHALTNLAAILTVALG